MIAWAGNRGRATIQPAPKDKSPGFPKLLFEAGAKPADQAYKDLRYSTKSALSVALSPRDFFVLYVWTTASSVGALPLWKYGACCHSPCKGAVRYCLVALRDA